MQKNERRQVLAYAARGELVIPPRLQHAVQRAFPCVEEYTPRCVPKKQALSKQATYDRCSEPSSSPRPPPAPQRTAT
eukprot:scaffold43097_cov62-Phaeocystis_antarctica.AAC.3